MLDNLVNFSPKILQSYKINPKHASKIIVISYSLFKQTIALSYFYVLTG